MPAAPSAINLFGNDELSGSPYGRIVSWALTYGRYIMIGTEIVVLLAFLSRFSLDRKLTDLREEIEQKQAIISANQVLESDIRQLQERLIKIKSISAGQSGPLEHLTLLQTVIPYDVNLVNLETNQEKIVADVSASSTDGLNQLLNDFQSAPSVARVDIGDMKRSAVSGIEFHLSVYLKPPKS